MIMAFLTATTVTATIGSLAMSFLKLDGTPRFSRRWHISYYAFGFVAIGLTLWG